MQKIADSNSARTAKHRAALKFGSKIPIFPCRKDKTPYTPHGHLDATTDRSRLNAWWNRYPDANPAMPTGERSGVFVLDVDADKWGFGSLEVLQEENGELPTTYAVKTGGGGLHHYFRLPPGAEIRNSAGKLGRGLDVRGEGGYVLLPTSTTERTYEVLEKQPIADAPAWLVELLREPDVSAVGDIRPRQRRATNASADGPPILEGERDNTLASIAGKLHDGSRTLTDLEAELLEINEARCVPPLPERQVLKTASSIYRRTPCKPSRGEPSAKTLEALDAVEAEVWRREWSGMGGKSERDAAITLIKQARQHSELIPAGVRVSISVRSWALATAVSKRAMLDHWKNGERKPGIISRLERAGIIRADRTGQSGTNSAAYILVLPRAEFHHSNHQRGDRTSEEASGETLRAAAPFTAPRLRWSAPSRRPRRGLVRGTRRVRQGVRRPPRDHIKRLGKGAGAVIDALEALGGELPLCDLYGCLHPDRSPQDRKRWRPRDLKRRVIDRLEDAGVVRCEGDTVSLTPEWLEALNRDRERGGEIEAFRRDMRDYKEQSEAYHNRHKVKPGRAPTEEEMRERREAYSGGRRGAIAAAIAELFRERPEYRGRRVGQITCAIAHYLRPGFPRGSDGYPKDAEVEAILEGDAA
jgi:Bifunctional DNA primase/polymerase, N-terminal/Primase C terminal 1 (PriCT-1)